MIRCYGASLYILRGLLNSRTHQHKPIFDRFILHKLGSCSNLSTQCHRQSLNARLSSLVLNPNVVCSRWMSESSQKELIKRKESPYAGLTTTEKVREASKDVTYTAIIILGVGITGFMLYAIFRELMSGQSPTGVYRKAYKLCKKTTQITDVLGEPLKCYGEENRRGRRRHVRHHEYEVNGVKHMRLKFYIEGPRGKGTVQLEVKKNDSDKYEYRYLFVELDNFPQRTIILEDNR